VEVGPGGLGAGEEADAALTSERGLALGVLTADCAPVALASPEGVVGVAHAGWRGLRDGVIEAVVAAMRDLGASSVLAALGPCIHPECYPFDTAELDEVAGVLGPSVRALDRSGAPALDLPAGVRSALGRAGAELVADASTCTACDTSYWSWRVGRHTQRQATLVWR